MTNEEAIKMFSVGVTAALCERKQELYRTAIEALEKQIPKKPKIPQEEFDDLWRCPACNAGVCDRYCSCCGQALDWRNVK